MCPGAFYEAMLACLVVNAASVAAAPGEKRWELPLGTCTFGAPALATNGDLLVTTCEGRLWAVTPAGAVRWSIQPSQNGLGTPTVTDDGTIYIGSDKLYALNPDGSKRWEFAYSDPYTGYTYYLTDPLVGPDGAIYVTRYTSNGEQRLFAVNPDGSLRWILKERFSAPPVIAEDGTLYLPEDYGFFAAVNPDGLLRWKVQVGNSTYASATPIAGGSVLVPVSGPNILEGSIQALTGSGSNLWRFEGGSPALGSPVVGPDGTIYYGFNAGRVVALETNGQLRWEYQIEDTPETYPSVWSPALAADGTLYVNGERWLHALNSSGQLLWRFDTGRIDLGPPMIGGDGTVYFGSGGTNGVLYAVEGTGAPLAASGWPMVRRDTRHRASIASPVILPSAPTNLTATLDVHTDKVFLRWNSVPRATHYQLLRGELPDLSQAAVLVDGFTGTNVFEDRTAVPGASYQYFVRATNLAGLGPAAGPVQGRRRVASAGETVWTLPTGGAINGSPAIGSNGNAFAVSSDGSLYAADSAGHLRWTFKYGGRISGSPSVDSDGTIHFAGAANRYPASEHISVWAITDSGQLKWRLPLDADWASDVAIGSGGELYITARLYAAPETYRLIAISRDGTVQWSFSNGQIFESPPIIAVDGTIYCGTRVGQVLALRPGGTLLWEFASQDPYLGALILDANGGLIIGSISMQALNPDGQSRWRFPFSNGGGPWCIDPNGVIYGGNADRRVYALFPQGTRKWDVAIAGEPRGAAVGADGAIYVTQAVYFPLNTTLSVFSASGIKQWDFNEGGAATGAPVIGDGIVCFGSSDGLVYAVKTTSGPGQSAWPQTRNDSARTGRATQAPPLAAAPGIVSATFRSRVTDVRLSWNSVIGASAYQVFRSSTTNLAEAVLLRELTGQLFFDDNTAIAEAAYTYWIKAKNVTGVSPFSAPASGMRRQAVSGELLYEWNLGGIIDRSPAIADDGTVYVSVNLPTFGSTDPGRKVVAVRPNGTIRWQYSTGNAMLTAPTLSGDGTIYVGIRGALNQFPYPSPLLALNPDGTKRWEFMTDDAVETTPVLGQDGTIYVGSAIGTLYAVTSGGQSTWSTNLGSGVGSLAVGRDRTVYALSRDGRLTAVRPDGSLLWSIPAGLSTPPGLAIGKDGEIYVAGGALKAFNPDGTVRWQTAQGNAFYTSPIVASNGLVILADDSASLRGYDSRGSNVWNATIPGRQQGAAALGADGVLYLTISGGQLFAFTVEGSNVWTFPFGALATSPAIAPDGTIYFGSDDGTVRSVFGSSPLAPAGWPMFQRDRNHTGRDPSSATLPAVPENLAASDGTHNDRVRVSWTSAPAAGFYTVWRHTQNDSNAAVQISGLVAGQAFFDDKAAVPGTNYFYWVRSGNGIGTAPLSQPDTGYRRIAVPGEPVANFHPNGPAGSSPVAGADGTLYFGAANARFYALWPDLTKKWEFRIGDNFGYFSTATVGLDGTLYFAGSDGRFYALNPDGSERWSVAGQYRTFLPPALASENIIVIADANRTVRGFDTGGEVRWQYAASSALTCAPSVGADGAVFVATEDGELHALNANGLLRWRFRAGGRIQASPAVGADGVVYFGSEDRGIYAVGPDGRRRWAIQAGAVVTASPVIAPDSTVIAGSQDRRLYAIWPDGTKRWDFLAESAIQSSACVGSDGMIYFGTRNGWVYGLNKDGVQIWSFNSATNGPSGSVFDSPLLLEDRLLVPIYEAGLQALSVTTGPANVNWPQFRRDAQRTARARSWLSFSSPPPTAGLIAGESVTLTANFSLTNRTVTRLELWSGTNIVATANGTNSVTWSGMPAGAHLISLAAVDDAGNVHRSPTSALTVATQPRVRIAPTAAGGWQLDFESIAGRQYQVERSGDLGAWSPASGPLTAASTNLVWMEGERSDAAYYYRVRVLP